jgi:hypothetical protein
MNTKKSADVTELSVAEVIDETVLFECVSAIIESRKSHAASYANREITLMYWEVGRYINSVVLDFKRAEYGKKIFATLSRKLVEAVREQL